MSIISAVMYFILFNLLLRHPYIFVIAILIYIFRDRIPNPAAFFRRQKAFTRLKHEVAINPYDSTARRDLGLVLMDKMRPRDALDNFIEALRKEKDSAELNHLVGLAYLRSGDAGSAVGHLRKAIEIDPRLKYGESHMYLGEALLELKRPEEALESLKAYLAINNTSIEGLYDYARALNALGRKDEAKKAIEDGIKYHKANPGFRRRRDWRWYVKLKKVR